MSRIWLKVVALSFTSALATILCALVVHRTISALYYSSDVGDAFASVDARPGIVWLLQ
jgi:quinol-cytochrome oxidoreductase complex cytochrome b subunit